MSNYEKSVSNNVLKILLDFAKPEDADKTIEEYFKLNKNDWDLKLEKLIDLLKFPFPMNEGDSSKQSYEKLLSFYLDLMK